MADWTATGAIKTTHPSANTTVKYRTDGSGMSTR
jgi:hypothetical protein